VITSVTNDVAAAQQDIDTRGAVASDVRAALASDLDRARRIGMPAAATVAADWSDALNQLSSALQARTPDPYLEQARQDLLALGQVVGS
jgi:hypothetical protein